MPVPAYRPLPIDLTAPLVEPLPPAALCLLNGSPVVCLLDGLETIHDWRAVLQVCNDDRAKAARISNGGTSAQHK